MAQFFNENLSKSLKVSKSLMNKILVMRNRFLWTLVRLVQVKPQTPLLNQENDANNEAGKSGEQPTAPKNTKPGSDSKPNPRPEDGPPDLDELWNDFNRKLGSLFGNKNQKPTDNSNSSEGKNQDFSRPEPINQNNSNNNPKDIGNKAQDWIKRNMNNSNNNGKKPNLIFPKIGAGIVLLGIFVVWMFSGIFIVQEGQAGLVLQFGKFKDTTRPGINWRLPFPIQSHEIVNVSNVRSVEIGRSFVIQATNLKDSSMLTEDENIIDVKFAVQYRLKDPTDYLFLNRDPDAAVVQAAETSVREIVGKSKMDDVLYVGRERIGIDLASSIQAILDSYKTGIFITSVNVQNVQPPEQVQASFDDAVKAGQDQERQKNEGQAYANDIVPRAKGAAGRLIEEAEGYKAKVVATAEGDASRFKQIYSEYSKAPQITRDRMYIDVMQQIYQSVTKVIVDTHSSNQLLYLPLDKLIQQATPRDANSPAGPGALNPNSAVQPPSGSITVPLNSPNNSSSGVVPATPGNSNSDKRDLFRSRERN